MAQPMESKQDGIQNPQIHREPTLKATNPNLGFGSVESPWTGRALLTVEWIRSCHG